jgi:hypothetical protein
MLEIACAGACGEIINNSICLKLTGCRWTNLTGLCHAAEDTSLSEESCIGIVLALIGNIIIKYFPDINELSFRRVSKMADFF